MPHFALTRQGYDQLIIVFGGRPPSPLWINAGMLSTSELTVLRAQGLEVTEFSRPIPLEDQGLDDAISTIKEHHPSSPVWVQRAA